MKTILLVGSYSPSLVNFRGALIVAMLARGHEVHVCAPDLSEDTATCQWLEARGVVWHEVQLSRTGLNPAKDIGALVSLFRIMRRVRPDIVLGYTIKPVIWGTLAARLSRVPQRVALITGLGYAFTGTAVGGRGVIRRIAWLLYALAMRSVHLVFFQNPDDRADFRRLGLLPESASAEIVNGSGVDTEYFARAELPSSAPRFLLIARLLGDKGIREYAAAAKQLSRRWPEAEFHLVGGLDSNPDGISQREVEDWVRNGYIAWHGALDDVRAAISQCHVYVLPSYREGTPRTVLEAMSVGRGVVTTDAPGCRETVENGVNGFLVKPRDVVSLAAAMERFLSDPNLIEKTSAASRRLAVSRYDVKRVNAVMIAALGL